MDAHVHVALNFERRCLNMSYVEGPAGVTELMQRHPKRQEVQKRGLRALRDMAYKGRLPGLT